MRLNHVGNKLLNRSCGCTSHDKSWSEELFSNELVLLDFFYIVDEKEEL